eukprot:49-Heterococcus_DN1.PRE.1
MVLWGRIAAVTAAQVTGNAPAPQAAGQVQRALPEGSFCLDEEVSVLLQPCRHLVLCGTCAPGVQICPVCRGPITQRDDVYT